MADWNDRTPPERALVLYRFARALREETRALAALAAEETNLPVAAARVYDAGAAAEIALHFAGWADKLTYAFPARTLAPTAMTVAVVSGTLPLARLTSVVAPALACGSAVVAAAPHIPRTLNRFVTIAARAGLSDALQTLGTRDVPSLGARVDRGNLPEGKTSHLVFADASLDAAVEAILAPISLAGGIGGGGSRVFVAESVAGELLRRLRARLARIRTGDAGDATTDVGTISSGERAQLDDLIEDATSLGATAIRHTVGPAENAHVPPVILADAVPAHRAVNEPYRGPLVPVVAFRTPDEAIARANHVTAHAGATIWTSQTATALYASRALSAPMVWCGSGERVELPPALATLRRYLVQVPETPPSAAVSSPGTGL